MVDESDPGWNVRWFVASSVGLHAPAPVECDDWVPAPDARGRWEPFAAFPDPTYEGRSKFRLLTFWKRLEVQR